MSQEMLKYFVDVKGKYNLLSESSQRSGWAASSDKSGSEAICCVLKVTLFCGVVVITLSGERLYSTLQSVGDLGRFWVKCVG